VAYNLRDVDGSADNSTQQVALQYRVGTSGVFTNIAAGYVADASTGPSLNTQVTPISLTLPIACENEAQVQLRIMTTNAVGNDEWIGVDDISIGGTLLPVELTSFTGIAKGKVVELAWQTATEVNNHGFEIERRSVTAVNRSLGVNGSLAWTKIGFVAGNGTVNSPKSYSYVDASAKGNVVYRLKQIDNDGKFEYHGAVEVSVGGVTKYTLAQNYPNPFNPATQINYALPAAGYVNLKVYDMLGKEVATLVNGMQEAGEQHATFTASEYPSGLYFYTLRTGSFVETKKMLLVK
jgi:hypothetical protein